MKEKQKKAVEKEPKLCQFCKWWERVENGAFGSCHFSPPEVDKGWPLVKGDGFCSHFKSLAESLKPRFGRKA